MPAPSASRHFSERQAQARSFRFSLTGCKSGLPKTPSSGLADLLEWLTKLRETFFLQGHQFIRRGRNSEAGRWKGRTRQAVETGRRAPLRSPGAPLPSPPLSGAHQPEALGTPPSGCFARCVTQARLTQSLATGYWFDLQPISSLPGARGVGGGGDGKFQPSNHQVGSPGKQLRCFQKSPSSQNKMQVYPCQHLGNSNNSGSQEPGTMDRDHM